MSSSPSEIPPADGTPAEPLPAPLDLRLAPFGLQGRSYLMHGRQYHGRLQGRELHIYVSMRTLSSGGAGGRSYHGHVVEVYLGTPLSSRFAAHFEDNALAEAMNQKLGLAAVPGAAEALPGLKATSIDPDWAAGLLALPEVREALLTLLEPDGPHPTISVQLNPLAWTLRVRTHIEQIHAERSARWRDALLALADAAESLPPPTVTAEPGRFELRSRRNRSSMTWWILGAIFLVLMLILCLMFACAATLALVTS